MYPDKQAPEKKQEKLQVILRELRNWTAPKTISVQLGIAPGHCSNLMNELGFFKAYITADEKAFIAKLRAASEYPASK